MEFDIKQIEVFLDYIIKGLLEAPEKASLEVREDDLGILASITMQGDEVGKFIGKNGKTVKSIRTLLRAVGAKYNKKINLKIIEEK
ncbi:MAG: KH domain-containing protein [Candidatus Gracilibacteria bacterium]|jgi:predicted RNA-binding protein YlqC (UPF0109 family)|nr:KH domain-containing protein [Candidatus Gracilibacteria bacterium]